MKRLVLLTLSIMMAMFLTACGNEEKKAGEKNEAATQQTSGANQNMQHSPSQTEESHPAQ